MSGAFITLTEIEALGLKSECNMADGHAYHNLSSSQAQIVRQLPHLWVAAAEKKHSQAEHEFKTAFQLLSNCSSLEHYSHFKICPTASNSIDTVGTWLKANNYKTLLIEPTFDNLALILKRRGVEIDSVLETEVFDTLWGKGPHLFDALFLVNPNNPTGKTFSETEFRAIVEWCASHNKVLLLDNTFRFFVPQTYDTYQILLDSGVTFVSIEDTGKVWPTQDLKASLLFFSADIASQIFEIYEEIYLCVSNFQLELLKNFLLDAHTRGLESAVWSEVKNRRSIFRKAIENSFLEVHSESLNSNISVEWVNILSGFGNDFEIMNYLNSKGLVVLPGRHFYWNSHGPKTAMYSLRFSLLKNKVQFDNSIIALKNALLEFPFESRDYGY